MKPIINLLLFLCLLTGCTKEKGCDLSTVPVVEYKVDKATIPYGKTDRLYFLQGSDTLVFSCTDSVVNPGYPNNECYTCIMSGSCPDELRQKESYMITFKDTANAASLVIRRVFLANEISQYSNYYFNLKLWDAEFETAPSYNQGLYKKYPTITILGREYTNASSLSYTNNKNEVWKEIFFSNSNMIIKCVGTSFHGNVQRKDSIELIPN